MDKKTVVSLVLGVSFILVGLYLFQWRATHSDYPFISISYPYVLHSIPFFIIGVLILIVGLRVKEGNS